MPCLWKFRSLFQAENWETAEKSASFRLALPSKFPGASLRVGKVSFPFPRESAATRWEFPESGETLRDGHGVGMQTPLFGCCYRLGTAERRGQGRPRSPVSPAWRGKLLSAFPEGAGRGARLRWHREGNLNSGKSTAGRRVLPAASRPSGGRSCPSQGMPQEGTEIPQHFQTRFKWPKHKRIREGFRRGGITELELRAGISANFSFPFRSRAGLPPQPGVGRFLWKHLGGERAPGENTGLCFVAVHLWAGAIVEFRLAAPNPRLSSRATGPSTAPSGLRGLPEAEARPFSPKTRH